MDPKSYKAIEDFVRAFELVSGIIKERNPDCIIAPMFGSVPFIDVLNIVDDEFPNNLVEYVPASSKVHKVRDVLRGVFKQLIINQATSGGASFMSIDEVVSGNSMERVYKQFDAARTQYANEKTLELYGDSADFTKENIRNFRDSVIKLIRYNSIGVIDSKMEHQGKPMAKQFNALLDCGIAIPVKTQCIVTMDRMDYFPAKYKIGHDSEGKKIYLPVVEGFDVTKEYVDFLMAVSEILGKNTANVTVRNMAKIRASYKLVPEYLRSI